MASKDSFSIAQSTTQESSRSETKWRSPVQDHCSDPNEEDREDLSFLYYSNCTPENAPKEPYSSNVPTNMKQHLFRKHQIVVEKATSKIQASVIHQLEQLHLQTKADSQVDDFNTQVLKSQLNIAVILEALITLIVVRNLPFSIIKWPEFHTLCQALNSQCVSMITIAHSTIQKKIADAWASHKDTVQ